MTVESARSALRPRALLLTLYGAYLRDVGGWAPVADLVTLMEDVDVSAHSTRSAISRMKQAGFLAADQRHGAAGYALTEEATAILRDGDDRIYHSIEPADAGGDWIMVVYSVPEAERAKRHQLRTRLARLGFGQLTSGVWIAPKGAAPHLRRMLHTTGLDGYVTTWTGRPADPFSIERWVADAWDLSGLAASYRDFAAEHEPVVAALEDQAADDRAAFSAYMRLLSHWRRLPFMDPGLPSELLPSPWPGIEAREVFARAREALEPRGRRHVMATIGVTAAND